MIHHISIKFGKDGVACSRAKGIISFGSSRVPRVLFFYLHTSVHMAVLILRSRLSLGFSSTKIDPPLSL